MSDNVANQIIAFKPNEIAESGNKFLGAILAHDIAKQEAEAEVARASERESLIDAQFIQVAMFLHEEERLDVMGVYGDKQTSAALYRAILTEMGVLRRDVKNDKVVYNFTDPNLEGAFNFEQAIASYKHDKEKDEKPLYDEATVEDHKRRRSRRNGLNVRLQRICKAAVALIESKATVNDIVISQDESGETVVKITKGPKELMGSQKEVSIGSKTSAKVEGATQTPTVTGLSKIADAKHKATKATTETSNHTTETGKAEDRESDFLALVNTLAKTINAREGQFTNVEKTSLKALVTTLKENGVK